MRQYTFTSKTVLATKGSFNPKGKYLQNDNPRLKEFTDNICATVWQQTSMRPVFTDGTFVICDRVYYPPMPKKSKHGHPYLGDIDKFDRALFDALTKSRLIHDDKFVVGGKQLKVWDRNFVGTIFCVREIMPDEDIGWMIPETLASEHRFVTQPV